MYGHLRDPGTAPTTTMMLKDCVLQKRNSGADYYVAKDHRGNTIEFYLFEYARADFEIDKARLLAQATGPIHAKFFNIHFGNQTSPVWAFWKFSA
jgi:hypothetical protein